MAALSLQRLPGLQALSPPGSVANGRQRRLGRQVGRESSAMAALALGTALAASLSQAPGHLRGRRRAREVHCPAGAEGREYLMEAQTNEGTSLKLAEPSSSSYLAPPASKLVRSSRPGVSIQDVTSNALKQLLEGSEGLEGAALEQYIQARSFSLGINVKQRYESKEEEDYHVELEMLENPEASEHEMRRQRQIARYDIAFMGSSPEEKYKLDKTLMTETFDRGEIHLLEEMCVGLLWRQPSDYEVWKTLTQARLRQRIWDAALEAARRWADYYPNSVHPRIAEAFALAGQKQYGEARARFSILAEEVDGQDEQMARDLRECVWRVDELWTEEVPGECVLSARPATVLTGARPPHFFLPNFAEAIGPLAVLPASRDELGGGQSHSRKVVVVRDVRAGEALFVQAPLAMAKMHRPDEQDRLHVALAANARVSPRSAMMLEFLADSGPLEKDNDMIARLVDGEAGREGGPLSPSPAQTLDLLKNCEEIMSHSYLTTGLNLYGVWTLAALCRHSCVPSANWTVWGDTLIARANQDLKAGDEVTIAFFNPFQPLESRREVMKKMGRGFICRCPRCEAEKGWNNEVSEAGMRLVDTFYENRSSTRGILEQISVNVQRHRMAMDRLAKAKLEENLDFKDGLMGLADIFRALDSDPANPVRVEDEDLPAYREGLPKRRTLEDMFKVDVPKELIETLLNALQLYDDEISTADLPELQKHWARANYHNIYYEVLSILSNSDDLDRLKPLLEKDADALTSVSMEVTSLLMRAQQYDVALNLAVTNGPVDERAPQERALLEKALRLRYGQDLDEIEVEAAIARLLFTKAVDENWIWDVTWCIGQTPNPKDEDLSPSAARPAYASLEASLSAD